MKASEITRGTRFSFAGFRWLAIDPQPDGACALLYEVPELLKRRPFAKISMHRAKDCSGWRQSAARHTLREFFLPEILKKIDGQDNKLLEMTVDLTALDGTNRTTSTDIIALLSIDQYRQHVDVIGATHAEFWTLTKASAKIPMEVVTIKSDGTVRADSNPKLSVSELRPVIKLAPDAEVEVELRPVSESVPDDKDEAETEIDSQPEVEQE